MDKAKGNGRSAGGWRFVSVPAIAGNSPQTVEAAGEVIKADAMRGGGLFASAPTIPMECEALDEYLGVEAYGMKCTLTPFLDALRLHGVIGGARPFLSVEITKALFAALRHAALFMKGHTDKPQAVRNEISRIDTLLGGVPVWGLILQILFADGVRCLLDGVTGEGAAEAASVRDWLAPHLAGRLASFTFTPYGEGDLARLAPLGAYLADTELGQMVQDAIFRKPHHDWRPQLAPMPPELDTDEAAALFRMAIDAGLMDEAYKWRKGIQTAAWFASKASERLALGKGMNADGTPRIAWKPFAALFGMDAGKMRHAMADIRKIGQPPRDAIIIDAIFDALR